jgi:regulator of sigma E protease
MSFIIFIAILVALVWVHELGHFSVAKLFGIRVDEFAIGFPPRLLTVKWGETRYSFNLILVGGYVSIHGENDSKAEDPRSFAAKPRPVQAAVVVAGIISNVLFAWLILSAGYMAGLPSAIEHDGVGDVTNARPTIISVLPGSPAQKAGIEANDIVLSVETAREKRDLRTLNTDRQAVGVHDFLTTHQDDSIGLVVERRGEEKDFIVRAAEGLVDGRKVLGVQLEDMGVLRLPPHLALVQGAVVAKNILVEEAKALSGFFKNIFVGQADFAEVSGPIGIVNVGSQMVNQGWATIIFITALISINLALINVLPVPGLDGGRLLFIVIESIIRRPISPRLATGLTIAGFALVITLMVVISAHDIAKLVG